MYLYSKWDKKETNQPKVTTTVLLTAKKSIKKNMTNRLESLTQKTSDSVSVTNLKVFHELLIGYNGVLTKNFINTKDYMYMLW